MPVCNFIRKELKISTIHERLAEQRALLLQNSREKQCLPPPPSIDNPLYMDYPPFLKENLEPTFYDFQKSQPLCQWGGFTLWQVLI